MNTSLFLTNITRNTHYYQGDEKIVRYNEAVWLARSGKYLEAKERLSTILTDLNFSHRAEMLELYGDILYSMSGATDEVEKLYTLSLDLRSEPRVVEKLTWLKNQMMVPQPSSAQTGVVRSGATLTGADIIDAKKKELDNTSKMRKQFLQSDGNPGATANSKLQELIQSERTGQSIITQDW